MTTTSCVLRRHMLAAGRRRDLRTTYMKGGIFSTFTRTCTVGRMRPFSDGIGDKEDPDNFRGPGGLTARELFQKVQESAGRDAQYAEHVVKDTSRKFNAASAAEHPEKNQRTQNDLHDCSVKELRSILDTHSVDHSDCFEKSELVRRVRSIIQ